MIKEWTKSRIFLKNLGFWIGALALIFFSLSALSFLIKNRADEIPSADLIGISADPAGFLRADGSHTWDFPRDFGPHPAYQTEWWYYTGNLVSQDGSRFGYQLTFFRRGLLPPNKEADRASTWGGNQVYMAHFAVSDISSAQHFKFERFSRAAAGLAGAQSEPFRVWLENWEVIRFSENQYQLKAAQGDILLELVLNDTKGKIFHGMDGYSQKGPQEGAASYYFSQTRLESKGSLLIAGNLYKVDGLSWMDHEFSTSALSKGQVGWDWFSIQLDDGSDLMVFQIRQADGSIDPYSSGTLISATGETIHLTQEEFNLQSTGTWRSPHTGVEYPSSWQLQVQSIDMVLDLYPYLADQEMILSYIYWEGAVSVQGFYQGKNIAGSGYVELTGYAQSMEGEF